MLQSKSARKIMRLRDLKDQIVNYQMKTNKNLNRVLKLTIKILKITKK